MSGMCSYEGQRVLVVGCSSGIGRATAKGLLDLGAEVYGADVADCDLPLAKFMKTDARNTNQIHALIESAGALDAVFYCSGLPQTRPFIDVMKVNFLGMRHLIEAALPNIKSGGSVSIIASTAGNGWMTRHDVVNAFIDTPSFEAGVSWLEGRNEALGDPYMFSKEAVILWVMKNCARFVRRGVRLNCLSPGPTISGMTPDFDSFGGPALIDVYTQPLGRRSSPEEQAWPLIFLGSKEASYINGCNFMTDAGFTSSAATGQIDVNALVAKAVGQA